MVRNGTSAQGSMRIEQKILQSFEDDLNSQDGQPLDLTKWVREVPAELRGTLFPQLLTRYLSHCVERGWTVSKDVLIQQFPEFRDMILHLYGSGVGEASWNETTSTRSLQTTTVYAVNEQVWKAGGQGTLHKSHEASIGNRQVVVKFLNDLSRKDNFQKEVEVTAKLDHPGVAAVYSQGVEQDELARPFFAMRLIHGKTLEERIAEFHNRLHGKSRRQQKSEFSRDGGIAELIEHIISACNTVSHAHSVGVLHCDLKPRNIICGRFGATIVLDWGSAVHCDVPEEQFRDSTQTIELPSGTTLDMTLPYASPEQMAAANHEGPAATLSTASDVFSLGATLYQVLTGTTPFNSQRTKDSKPDPPRQKNASVSKRLNAICVKAMQHAPEDRYASVEALADDLRNWLRDEPIQAVADNLADRSFRVARRHKGATLASLALLFVLIAATGLGIAMRKKQGETLHNLDLTLTLIEDVCRPLGKDEVQNFKEFDEIADQVDEFTTNYIERNPAGDRLPLARIYKIKAIVRYYLFNSQANHPSVETNPAQRRTHLVEAIDYLQQAEELYEEADVLSRAENRLTQARWFWYLSKTRSQAEGAAEDHTRALERLEDVIRALQKPTEAIQPQGAPHVLLAEAFHLRGEIWHAHVQDFEQLGFDSANAQLDASLGSFETAIKLLENLPDSERTMDISRNLARAYGYRGDLYRSRGEVSQAWADYDRSLTKRQEIAQGLGNAVESNFQLARGYTNFGMLARDFGSQIPGDLVFPDAPENPGQPIEFQIAEAHIAQALAIQSEFKEIGDQRFRDDFYWTSNVAAELYLFAAENDKLPLDQKQAYLAKAEDLVDGVILTISGERPQTWLAAPEIARPDWAPDRRTLALSLLLKLRIDLARDEPQHLIEPEDVRALIPLAEGFASHSEEELLIYLLATLAEGDKAHIGEIQQQLKRRRFNKLNRLRKHLQGLHLKPEMIEKVLAPWAGSSHA